MSITEDILIKNAELFIVLIKNGSTEEKCKNINSLINGGANVNECFTNNGNNTPLHIAVRKGEQNVVKLLLEMGADLTLKNSEGKTALDIARELNTDMGRKIFEILSVSNKKLQRENRDIDIIKDGPTEKNNAKNKLSLYQKRSGTTGIKGELYETKLLSLILIRMLLSKKIDEFYLGTSVQDIGALDDICLRYRENDEISVVFVQAKHIIKGKVTDNDLWRETGNFSLTKYFNSYLKIRQKYESTKKDDLFQDKYEDNRFYFIIYTTAEDDLADKKILNKHSIGKTVKEILSTTVNLNIFQYKYDDGHIRALTKVILTERMKQTGKILFQSIKGNKYKNMMRDTNIRNYHIVLAQKVIAVSQTIIDDARIGSFRDDFLSSNNELLSMLKEIIFKEAVAQTRVKDDDLIRIVDLALFRPTTVNISKLIQSVPTTLKHNRLEIFNNTLRELFQSSLYETIIPLTTFSEAFQIAVKEKLGCLNFKLPLAFGNVDIKVNELDAETTLDNIALKIENIISECEDNNIIITSRDKLDPSLIGNPLISDEDNGLLKFNTCTESLSRNANNILNKLKNNITHLDIYRFKFNIDNIPKTSFEADEYDNSLAKDFLNNLWFYTGQAKENEIDVYARDVLEEYYNTMERNKHNTFSQVQSDAIFLKIHNEVQKWWLLGTTQAHYLTKNIEIFNKILNDSRDNSLLNILNYIYINEIQNIGINFNEQAIQSLGLDTLNGLVVIETKNKTLTAVKLYQYFKQFGNYTFIDFNYISRLSLQDSKILLKELKNGDRQTTIIIYEHMSNEVVHLNVLLNLSLTKKIVFVINDNYLEQLLKKAFIEEYVKVRDDKNNLRDLEISCQARILQKTILFQGMEVAFQTLIDAESQLLIKENILNAIIYNKSIEIGKIPSSSSYEQIKDHYVQRSLYHSKIIKKNHKNVYSESSSSSEWSSSTESSENECNAFSPIVEELIQIKTLEDIKNTVVLMAAPGMGKSTLLTHLCIETKKNNPRLWIERINLLDHVADFYRWQKDELKIDLLEAIRFLCNTVLNRHFKKQNEIYNSGKIHFEIEVINGIVSLKSYNKLNPLIQLELELFINCYNKGNTIIIFDGFDEICPHYKNDVLQLLKHLAFRTFPKSDNDLTDKSVVKQQMWITSRPYNDIKKTLESTFGISYRLKPFTDPEQNIFVNKYLRINLNLKNLNCEQFQNIDSLFEYMKQFSSLNKMDDKIMLIKLTCAPLHSLYSAAIEYFQNEIRNRSISTEKAMFNQKWNANIRWLKGSELLASWNHVSEEAMNLARTPLHMFIAINYIENKIKSFGDINSSHQWDLDTNTFAFYDNFLETKLKKIRFEEKSHMDLQNPDLRITYERERVEFVTKHKQLAFYAIFKNHVNKILDSREIHDIQQTIRRIENGEEKTGLIEYVVNGVPKFVHLTFAEYLAVEYITDLLKTDTYEEQANVFEFILHVVLSTCSTGVLEVFDRKINCDPKLLNIISGLDLKQFIFDRLLDNKPYSSRLPRLTKSFVSSKIHVKSTLDIAVYYGMKSLAKLLLAAVTEKVTVENLNQFIEFVKSQYFFKLSIKYGYNELYELVLNTVRRVNSEKLYKLYYIPNRRDSRIPLFGFTNQEIIGYLKSNLVLNMEVYGREQRNENEYLSMARKKVHKLNKMKRINSKS